MEFIRRKIKALRAKTNKQIKTPVRGEEPVFVVTGPVPGQVTIQVRVPHRVGLVEGPKGATITRIQQQTHTYIVTPSRDMDPVFQVTGLPDNVQVAKREIEAHIAVRTGSLQMDNPNSMTNELTNPAEILASRYKSGISGLGPEGLRLARDITQRSEPESSDFLTVEHTTNMNDKTARNICVACSTVNKSDYSGSDLWVMSLVGLGASNSLSSSLSSVTGQPWARNGAGNMGSTGSNSSGSGSMLSLNNFSANPMVKMTTNGHNGQRNEGGFYQGHPALRDLGFSLMNNNTRNAFMSSSRSVNSYLLGNSGGGPNSIEEGSQSKLSDLFQTSVSSSLWGSFDRDEGLESTQLWNPLHPVPT